MEEAEETRESNSGDSDGAPESVSLSRGREEALESRRAASAEAKRAANRVKERRKRRQQLYASQKTAKEAKRETVRFPEDDLRELLQMEQDVKEQKLDLVAKSSIKKRAKGQRKTRTKTMKKSLTERDLGSVKVVALSHSNGTLPSSASRDTALKFLNDQLYNSGRNRRIPAATFHSMKYRNKPADVFV